MKKETRNIDINTLTEFFDHYTPGNERVKLSECETIVNQKLFIDSTLHRLHVQEPGSVVYRTELDRLRRFYEVVTDISSKPTRRKDYVTDKSELNNVTDNRKPCLTCKSLFVPLRSDAKFCSPGCKQSAYRKRQKLELT